MLRTATGHAWIVALLTALLAMSACGPAPDVDDEMLRAQGLLVGRAPIPDRIDPEDGDRTDWRELSYFEPSHVKVIYRIGDPLKPHDVRGMLKAFDVDARELDTVEVVPGKRDYELEFDVEADRKYFVVFVVEEGSSEYLVEAQAEPLDPCARCEDDEACVGGRCVPADEACSPPCRSGRECIDGRCRPIRCPRGEIYSKRRRACVPDPCKDFRCGADERCRLRGGKPRCVSVAKGCSPACGKGETCQKGRCVAAAKTCPPCKPGTRCDDDSGTCVALKKLSGRVLNFFPEGGKVVLILNRGSEHGVKAGQKGRVSGGGSFRVVEVYPFQCRAVTTVSMDQLGPKTTVTFLFE